MQTILSNPDVQGVETALVVAIGGLLVVIVGLVATLVRTRITRTKELAPVITEGEKKVAESTASAKAAAIKQTEEQRDIDQNSMRLIQQQVQFQTAQLARMQDRETRRDELVNKLSDNSAALGALNTALVGISEFIKQSTDAIKDISERDKDRVAMLVDITKELGPDGMEKRIQGIGDKMVEAVKNNSMDIGNRVAKSIQDELAEIRGLLTTVSKDVAALAVSDREKLEQIQQQQDAMRGKLDHVIEQMALNTMPPGKEEAANDPRPANS